MSWVLLLVSPALAGPSFIAELGPPGPVGVDGRHARPYRGTDGAWHLGHGRSGKFHDVVLDDNLVAQSDTARIIVEAGGDFVDHALAVCPDGSMLHAASGNLVQPDDTAWVTVLDADRVAGPTALLIDREPDMSTNDMAALCTADLRVAAFAGSGDPDLEIPQQNWLFPITDGVLAGAEPERIPLHEAPRLNGTSLVWDARAEQLLVIGMPGGSAIQVAVYDAALGPVGRTNGVVEMEPGVQAYWSSAAAQLGDGAGYAIAHMGRSPEQGFAQDTGDVYLTITDRSFFLTETVRLTNLPAPDGAMRPGLAVEGDELIIAWDQDGRFHAARARVDLDALAAASEDRVQDTGAPSAEDTVDADDGGGGPADPPAPETGGASGCHTAPGGGGLGLLLLAPLACLGRRA